MKTHSVVWSVQTDENIWRRRLEKELAGQTLQDHVQTKILSSFEIHKVGNVEIKGLSSES